MNQIIYDDNTTIIQNLLWLLVKQRIHLNISLTTYKSINDMGPEYLCVLVSIKRSSRNSKFPRLGSGHMVSVRLILQHPLCGIGYTVDIRNMFS